ncbi:MAG: flagellar hook-associated protein FlgK [Verrucomicrobiota bacterium]|jgi:flagellar hook-associated protein 1
MSLFGTLDLGQRALQAQRQGVEVTGHNLANVNNRAYTRQRVQIQTAPAIETSLGAIGTGANAAAIRQIRDVLIDRQIESEGSIGGYWEAQQRALQYAQANLGQLIDRQATGPEGSAAANGIGGQQGIAEGLQDLFNAFQGLSTNPTSLSERQVLLQKAATLATKFNQTGERLTELNASLNASVQEETAKANELLSAIARLNDQIANSELRSGGMANDLRDLRQEKVEELSRLVKFELANDPSGAIDLSVGGVTLVEGGSLVDSIEAYDAGGGRFLIRAKSAGTELTVAGGSISGTIAARDGALAVLKSDLDNLAGLLIREVNQVHTAGFSLTGSTGADFFSGTDATSLRVSAALQGNPALIQASGTKDAVGDNQIALALAQLSEKKHATLNGQTFHQDYARTVSALGSALAQANNELSDQNAVERMLKSQRDSVSGVSLDEEMTLLVKYQQAFEASARLITTVNELIETVVNLKR